MQSLFYMKWQIDKLLDKCRRSKVQVLCTPRIFDHLPKKVRRFFVKHPVDDECDRAALNKELERKMMKEVQDKKEVAGGKWRKKMNRFSDVVSAVWEQEHPKPHTRVSSKKWRS